MEKPTANVTRDSVELLLCRCIIVVIWPRVGEFLLLCGETSFSVKMSVVKRLSADFVTAFLTSFVTRLLGLNFQ